MSIYDISLPISESLVTWPGHPALRITQPFHMARGDRSTVSFSCRTSRPGCHWADS